MEIDLSKYKLRTDLIDEVISSLDEKKGITTIEEIVNDIKVIRVNINDDKLIDKKKGDYITISFDDVTDTTNNKNITKVFIKELKSIIKELKIKDSASCLAVGLGNSSSTPDSLGPNTIDKLIVTRHFFLMDIDIEAGFRSLAAINPSVTGKTGIETSDLLLSIINNIKPDFVIVIDALASGSIDRVNKTIQITNTGIHPGSGVGNQRKEISFDTLGIPVIAIGIPTVVDAVTIVSDTINYMMKSFSYNKENINKAKNKLNPGLLPNYMKDETLEELNIEEKKNMLGLVGSLSDDEIRQLIFEVLSPIGYNLMVTPKEVDFVIEKLVEVLANGINSVLHKKIDKII